MCTWLSRKIALVIFQKGVFPFSTLIISILCQGALHWQDPICENLCKWNYFQVMFQLNQIADLSLQKKRDASLSVKGRGGWWWLKPKWLSKYKDSCHRALERQQPPKMQHDISGSCREHLCLGSCHPVTRLIKVWQKQGRENTRKKSRFPSRLFRTLVSFFHLCCKIRAADSMTELGGSQVERRGLSLRAVYSAVTTTRPVLIQMIPMNSRCSFCVCIFVSLTQMSSVRKPRLRWRL